MSRMSPGTDQILVKPTNNIYTVLAVVGIVATIVAMIVICLATTKLTGKPLFPG